MTYSGFHQIMDSTFNQMAARIVLSKNIFMFVFPGIPTCGETKQDYIQFNISIMQHYNWIKKNSWWKLLIDTHNFLKRIMEIIIILVHQ